MRTKIEELQHLFETKINVARQEIVDCVWHRAASSLIESLQKKWYEIRIKYDEVTGYPTDYQFLGFRQPLRKLVWDIEKNHKDFADEIREKYYNLKRQKNPNFRGNIVETPSVNDLCETV
jgi:hypothetical protein